MNDFAVVGHFAKIMYFGITYLITILLKWFLLTLKIVITLARFKVPFKKKTEIWQMINWPS